MRQLVRVSIGVALAAGLTVVAIAAGGAAGATPASAATSSVGGKISKSEILTRMHDWYAKAKPAYGSGFHWDYGHTREYRADCSGFADMALHLSTDDWTGTTTKANSAGSFTTDPKFTHERNMDDGNRYLFTPSTIQTGDVFNDVIDGHAWVFASWASDGKHFSYYNFGGGSSGDAPPEYHTNALMTDDRLGYEHASNYEVWRYQNVTS